MKVRTFRHVGEAAVLALWERAGIGRPWLDLRAEIAEKRRRDRARLLVATVDGAVVGAAMGACDGRRGWVCHLAVEPARQGQGIGRALMAELGRRMARRGIVQVNLQVRADNQDVVSLSRRPGYQDERLTSLARWLRPPPGTG